MPDLGVRLQLLIGPTVATPAPYGVVDALQELEVRNSARERDGFDLTFSLGKEPQLDYGLLREGLLDPPNRVSIMLFFGVLPQVLINGIITRHQVIPSRRPGQSQLKVTGEDIGMELDLEERSATYRNQSDSVIVTQIVLKHGLAPDVTSTDETPPEVERITTQQRTDLYFIKTLAERNGFVFYVEPTDAPNISKAYWGPEKREGMSQPALTHDMGPESNVDQIYTGFNVLDSATPQVTITEPNTRQSIQIPAPTDLIPSLSGRSVTPMRTTVSRDSANLNFFQGMLRAAMAARGAGDSVTVSGELDSTRYGQALRARRLVDLRGVGSTYNGTYYVTEVTHRIKRGEYKQRFSLSREGLGASSNTVVT